MRPCGGQKRRSETGNSLFKRSPSPRPSPPGEGETVAAAWDRRAVGSVKLIGAATALRLKLVLGRLPRVARLARNPGLWAGIPLGFLGWATPLGEGECVSAAWDRHTFGLVKRAGRAKAELHSAGRTCPARSRECWFKRSPSPLPSPPGEGEMVAAAGHRHACGSVTWMGKAKAELHSTSPACANLTGKFMSPFFAAIFGDDAAQAVDV